MGTCCELLLAAGRKPYDDAIDACDPEGSKVVAGGVLVRLV